MIGVANQWWTCNSDNNKLWGELRVKGGHVTGMKYKAHANCNSMVSLQLVNYIKLRYQIWVEGGLITRTITNGGPSYEQKNDLQLGWRTKHELSYESKVELQLGQMTCRLFDFYETCGVKWAHKSAAGKCPTKQHLYNTDGLTNKQKGTRR